MLNKGVARHPNIKTKSYRSPSYTSNSTGTLRICTPTGQMFQPADSSWPSIALSAAAGGEGAGWEWNTVYFQHGFPSSQFLQPGAEQLSPEGEECVMQY